MPKGTQRCRDASPPWEPARREGAHPLDDAALATLLQAPAAARALRSMSASLPLPMPMSMSPCLGLCYAYADAYVYA